MDKKYAFTHQQHSNCGQWAIINALIMIGVPISAMEAHSKSKTTRFEAMISGTNEHRISKALRHYECNPVKISEKSPDKLKKLVDGYLDKNIPIIASVCNYEHWSVLAGRRGKKYFWIDSSEDVIIGYSSWNEILEWMDNGDEPYNGIAVEYDKDKSPCRDISALHKLRQDNEWLFGNYGRTLSDLLDIVNSDFAVPDTDAVDLFKNCRDDVVQNLVFLYEYADEDDLYELIDAYIILARLHNLKYSKKHESAVLIRLGIVLAFYILDIE
ncbi:MAG: hypothetical protein LWX56_11965 [Ignavibacteria bacterium]|nr:hypothetical protein [Ignavibacteria bacterium]